MSIFKTLQFDDIDTLDHGVYISGEGAYNAPERDVEMVTIPGRNGELILDNDRFANIEVTYPAGIKGRDHDEMRKKFREFRSLMASKRGYHRLVDEYNPDEFRLASFVNAIESEATGSGRAAEFELVFNCKPQRFLMSGEAAISVADGDRIFNPTPFDASPMIMVEGYGNLTVNGHEIRIVNEYVGDVTFAGQENWSSLIAPKTFEIDSSLLNTGDEITVSGAESGYTLKPGSKQINSLSPDIMEQINGSVQMVHQSGTDVYSVSFVMNDAVFAKGTPSSVTGSFTIKTHYNRLAQSESATYKVDIAIAYDGDSTITVTYTFATISGVYGAVVAASRFVGFRSITGYSTISTLGHPTYIDCDLGEVYLIDNGSFVSLNHLTDLGSYLPVLSPGENLIEYENTITSVEIIPRWWVL